MYGHDHASPIDGAWCAVREARGRLLVHWSGEGFDEIKLDFRHTFPRHADAIYAPTDKAWSLPQRHRRKLEAWLALWFTADAVSWERGEQITLPAVLGEAYRILCLTPDAPLWAVEAVYRAASKHLHPDHGGDHQTMVAVNQAVKVIRQHQETQS